jgi:hypothetical protein
MMVNVIPTPRTAAGAACPERPILAIGGYRLVFEPSRKSRCRRKLLMRQQGGRRASGSNGFRTAGLVCRLGTELHRVRVLQASGELFGRRSAVSPGVMYPGGQLLARGGGCSTRLIRRIQATPASEQDICIDVTYLSPDWRADSSKATTVRIYNRVDDKQLDCVR